MARLPQPGGDKGNWGEILNDFLSQSLNRDGTIKSGAVDKAAIGLSNVDNTNDATKPISTPQQNALSTKLNTSDLDTQTATLLTTKGSSARGALTTTLAVVDIRDYVNTGETLNKDGSAIGNNTAIIQRAVDDANTKYLANNQPVQIFFPDGTYKLSDTGLVPGGSTSHYAVQWKSGVGIKTNSRRGVRFVCPATASAFVAADNDPWENISHVYCDPHVVDGYLQTNATYTTKFKGWFIQGLADSYFDDVCIVNTFSTGFGCDFLQRTTVTGVADNCGRGLKELAIVPTTTSGGSGFGIGTGRFAVEDFTLDVVGTNCGFHGVFTEKLSGETYNQTKGARIRAYVAGNYVGFRDGGCDGLQATIVSHGNTYAEILHDKTILNTVMGINGNVQVRLEGGTGTGILFGSAITNGAYRFSGEIQGVSGAGVANTTGATIPDRLTLDLNIHDCGSHAVSFDASTTNLQVSVRAWNNGGNGLRLAGSTRRATDLTLFNCDFRSGGILLQQAIAGELLVTGSRGVSLSLPTNLVLNNAGTTLSWAAPLTVSGVTDYSVQYRRLGDTAWTAVTHTASTSTSITVPFNKGFSYEIQVAAVTASGTGSWSSTWQGQAGLIDIADHFNRTNVVLAGQTAPDGPTVPTWSTFTATSGVFSISTNCARPSSGGIVLATVPASANGAAQITMSQVHSTPENRRQALIFRAADLNNYWRITARGTTGDTTYSLQKMIAGTATTVAASTVLPTAGDIVRAEYSGTSISWYINEVRISTITDSTVLQTNTLVGMFGLNTTDNVARFDDFAVWVG